MKHRRSGRGFVLVLAALCSVLGIAASTADVDLMQAVRAAITADPSMSAHARNVSIEANEGIVTLSGLVATNAERAKVERLARRAGATRVESRLTVNQEIPSEER